MVTRISKDSVQFRPVAATQAQPRAAVTTASRPALTDELSTGKTLSLRSRMELLGSPPAAPSFPAGPFKPGQKSAEIDTMQKRLEQLGFLDPANVKGAEGVYGRRTTEAVREFQQANGIKPATGVADTATLARMGDSTALSHDQAMAQVANGGTTIIVPSIGTAGPGEVPTQATLQSPSSATITSDANVRQSANANTQLLGVFKQGTEVQVVQPQPAGGQPGWVYVSGTDAKGKALQGWVAHGASGVDRMTGLTMGDPRVQARMEQLGYCAPGYGYDAKTISDFQRMNGLSDTGVADDATLAAMWGANAKISTEVRQASDQNYNPSKTVAAPNENCGPTSVVMALASLGMMPLNNADPNADIEAMRKLTGGNDHTGTGHGQLETAISTMGGSSYPVQSWDDVKLAVSRGNPVILFNNDYGGHWVTVVGYDPKTNQFLVDDPMSKSGSKWESPDATHANFSSPSVAVEKPNP